MEKWIIVQDQNGDLFRTDAPDYVDWFEDNGLGQTVDVWMLPIRTPDNDPDYQEFLTQQEEDDDE